MDIRSTRFLAEVSYNYSKADELKVGNEVHLFPIEWNSEKRVLVVECQNVVFEIEEKELTIYKLTQFLGSQIPKDIYNIFRNRILSAKVCEFSDGTLYLSRRENMLDALNFFFSHRAEVFDALILNSNIPSLVFCEMGAGIVGAIHLSECTNCRIINAYDYLIDRADNYTIPVKILRFDENDNFKIQLSYKKAFDVLNFNIGDCCIGQVTSIIPNGSGVFVELNPLTKGILDVDYVNFFNTEQEAEGVEHYIPYVISGFYYPFIIRGKNSHGYKLSLIK